jgi:YVTN family beta-propeller protein
VGNDAEKEAESGVTVIDAQDYRVVAQIPTGPGHHEIAFSRDSLTAFVTNSGANTVSVIDVQRLEKRVDLPTGDTPLAVAFSALGSAAYVGAHDGSIAVVDARRLEVTRMLETKPGLVSFRLDPSGRWGFAALVEDDTVVVFDASNGAVAHRLEVGDRPHQFAFTTTYAYVRHLGTSDVTLIPLSQLGQESPPGLQTVAFGDKPPGDYPYPATADAISPTGEWTAVVTANPLDKTVYYYMEGMIAPMGSYGTYGRVPRAVGVVDRSVRETEEGVYAARFRVPGSGEYNVAMVLDQPFVDHCFAFDAVADPTRKTPGSEHAARIEFLNQARSVPAGQPVAVRFSLVDPSSEKPLSGLQDVVVLATRPPGAWQERTRATPLEDGVYEASVPADQAGAYYVSVSVPSLSIDFTDLAYMTFVAVDGDSLAQGEK